MGGGQEKPSTDKNQLKSKYRDYAKKTIWPEFVEACQQKYMFESDEESEEEQVA